MAPFRLGILSPRLAMRERGIETYNASYVHVKPVENLPHLTSKSLGPVTSALNIKIPERHRASGDAYATALVLVKFLSYLQRKQDIHMISELLRFSEWLVAGDTKIKQFFS